MGSPYDDLDRPPLHVEALRRDLVVSGSSWTALDVVDELPSTNEALAERAKQGAGTGFVLVAEHQSAGRGRLGRHWEAPARSSLMFSVLVHPDAVPASRWSWLPLLAGLAVAAAVRNETSVPAGLKWPNDIVVRDRKLGGVLVERVESRTSTAAAVIGAGLNVSTRPEELPVPGATSLRVEQATTLDRTVLLKAVLRSLDELLQRWQHSGGESTALRQAYLQACTTIGRLVEVHLPAGEVATGRAETVDDLGRLVVVTDDDRRTFGAGDVVHVRRPA